jgi:hypothetical protein
MYRLPPFLVRLSFCIFAGVAGGCAHPTAPGPALASGQEAAEEARREERLKVMQEYWQDRTGTANGEPLQGRDGVPLLEYPAGIYGGINFGPRLAADPSLAEPNR